MLRRTSSSLALLLALIACGQDSSTDPSKSEDPDLSKDVSRTSPSALPDKEAVQRWLIQHGVESARLTAKGYGPTRPIAPNITQQNRSRNRRVQFRIVRRADWNAAVRP